MKPRLTERGARRSVAKFYPALLVRIRCAVYPKGLVQCALINYVPSSHATYLLIDEDRNGIQEIGYPLGNAAFFGYLYFQHPLDAA